MKIIKINTLIIGAIALLSACKKTEPEVKNTTQTPTNANVTINFNNQVDGQAIELGQMKYTNAAGNMYQIDLLKYYVTNTILVKADNSEVALNNYDLINAAEANTCKVEGMAIPNGTYTKIKFKIGLPLDRNHNGAQDGDLDPAMGMIWDWNTGYVFFKHEGKYKNTANTEKALIFHYATDRALTEIEVPLSASLVVNGAAKNLYLNFNLNKLYSTPSNLDFNNDDNRQSSSAADYAWIDYMKSSFSDAFIFDKVE